MEAKNLANPEVEMFAFRGPEMAGILEASELEPSSGSPLRSLSAAEVDESAREVASQTGHAVKSAVQRIAVPERVVGLVTASPPEPPDFFWLYSGASDLDFAFHQEDETGMHRLAWPVDGLAMLDFSAAHLDLFGPVDHFGVSLALGREEFSVLVAIADFVQADALQGVLRHDPPLGEAPTFQPDDLVGLASRADESGDLRWMVTRARLMSPIELDFGEETLAPALKSLADNGLLLEVEGLFEVTPLLHKICLLAGTCTGFSAVSTRSLDAETGAWSLDHFALARGPETLLLYEFEDVTANDFLVSIDDVTSAMAFEWLQGGFRFEDVREEVEEPLEDAPTVSAPPSEPTLAPEFIEAAGREVGETLTPEPGLPPLSPPTGRVQQFCTQCGTVLDLDKGFCTQCGNPVKGGGHNG